MLPKIVLVKNMLFQKTNNKNSNHRNLLFVKYLFSNYEELFS